MWPEMKTAIDVASETQFKCSAKVDCCSAVHGAEILTEPRILCISQARMSSTRLPGKVMEPLAGRPLLQFHLERLQKCRLIDTLVVATTQENEDDRIVELCDTLGVASFRGSRDDVLGRFSECHDRFGGDVIVRVTSDCPLIDPVLSDTVIEWFLTGPEQPDLANLDLSRFPRGLDTEVFRSEDLKTAASSATDPFAREHVTTYLYSDPERYKVALFTSPISAPYRWCVDEAADLALVRGIVEGVGNAEMDFSWLDCLRFVEANPALADINRHVSQKTAGVKTPRTVPT